MGEYKDTRRREKGAVGRERALTGASGKTGHDELHKGTAEGGEREQGNGKAKAHSQSETPDATHDGHPHGTE